MAKLLEIFKPGKHTDMSGRSISFSAADLLATAQAYNPDIHEAPLVVGHPKDDDPAYGYAKGLSFADGHLLAEPHQVDTQFAELVNSGRFKHMSASFYLPEAPNNPVPGVYYLRHIGFLGAQAPAVKGLKAASFADNEQGVICFGDWVDETNASLWRQIRELIIEKFGLQTADSVTPSYQIDTLTRDALKPESDEPTLYSEKENMMDKARITELEGLLATSRAEAAQFKEAVDNHKATIATLTADISGMKTAQLKADCTAFCDALPTKISPAMRPVVIAHMMTLAAANPLEFGEGDNKKIVPALDAYKEDLGKLPDVVSFTETATTTAADSKTAATGAAEFGEHVDEDRLALHEQIVAYQEEQKAKGTIVSYQAAAQAVIKQ